MQESVQSVPLASEILLHSVTLTIWRVSWTLMLQEEDKMKSRRWSKTAKRSVGVTDGVFSAGTYFPLTNSALPGAVIESNDN